MYKAMPKKIKISLCYDRYSKSQSPNLRLIFIQTSYHMLGWSVKVEVDSESWDVNSRLHALRTKVSEH